MGLRIGFGVGNKDENGQYSSRFGHHGVYVTYCCGLCKVSDLSQVGSGFGFANKPAVPVEDSITPDHIICLEDGKAFKMLKKHLKTKYDLSPEEYRAKWGLPADYPMVAPNYAIKRQALAKASGLGRNR